jgi:Pyridine nucleotide-disulphide oxidoreductase
VTEDTVRLAIVGAGPFGLSAAASLCGGHGRVFGEPMRTWKMTMPADMILRSAWSETSLAAPDESGAILDWAQQEGVDASGPVPLQAFLAYAKWFEERFVHDLRPEDVTHIEARGGGFAVWADEQRPVRAQTVVIAVGVTPFIHMPTPLGDVDDPRVTPPLDPVELGQLSGERVLVIGGGQAALESAGIAAKAGARVELVSRSRLRWFADREPHYPRSRLGERLYRLAYPAVGYGPAPINRFALHPDLFAALPKRLGRRLTRRLLRPGGSPWLRGLIEGHVDVTEQRTVTDVEASGASLHVTLSDETHRDVDRLIVATGYRCDLRKLPFLDDVLRAAIRTKDGWPVLDRYFSTTVPNLYFVGYAAEDRFGPLSRFVLGTRFTVNRLQKVLGDR